MIHLELFTWPGGFGSCPYPTFIALQGQVIGSQDMRWKYPLHYPESRHHSCSFNVVNLSLLCRQYQGAFLLNSTLTMLTSSIATKHLKVLNVLSILEGEVRKSLFLSKILITFIWNNNRATSNSSNSSAGHLSKEMITILMVTSNIITVLGHNQESATGTIHRQFRFHLFYVHSFVFMCILNFITLSPSRYRMLLHHKDPSYYL